MLLFRWLLDYFFARLGEPQPQCVTAGMGYIKLAAGVKFPPRPIPRSASAAGLVVEW